MAQFDAPSASAPLTRLPFPPVTKQHILHCSYHAWHPRYRAITPKARLVPLTAPFLSYLRADGIILPPDEPSPQRDWSDDDSGIFSSTENPDAADDDDEDADPSAEWRDVHEAIRATVAELGGKVVPKLNWSAPKDATWINATNSMECRSPSDVYLLLKSSDFVTHDLEHAFDDTDEHPAEVQGQGQSANLEAAEPDASPARPACPEIPYVLVLRKHFLLNPSLEFRCFVRQRRLIAISQRDLNHFAFLFPLAPTLRARIQSFFDDHLRNTFPDPNFVFDVYVPPPHERAWLIDVNPWAQRTDPLLFSWLELLTMEGPESWGETSNVDEKEEVVRISLRPTNPQKENDSGSKSQAGIPDTASASEPAPRDLEEVSSPSPSPDSSDDEADADEEIWTPEIRLVHIDDPEAYSFATPQYSAHKLPRDVVDASRGGEGAMREFAEQWKEILARQQKEDEEASDSD